MDMCYDGALVMPSSYAVMDEEEMTYVEGGALVTTEAIMLAIALCGVTYSGAKAVGEWVGNMGVTTYEYNKIKWNVRLSISTTFGIPAMIGFENGFYSTAIY